MGLRDVGQLVVEHAGESEQGVALVLQSDPHRADASGIPGLAARQLLDDEVEQLSPGGQGRAGQGQNVMAPPLGERSDVAGQPMRLGLGLPGKRQRDGELVVWTPLAGAADPVACSVWRREVAPLARRASVVARPSHRRWMWNTSPWHGVSPQAAFCPARKPCPASAIV